MSCGVPLQKRTLSHLNRLERKRMDLAIDAKEISMPRKSARDEEAGHPKDLKKKESARGSSARRRTANVEGHSSKTESEL